MNATILALESTADRSRRARAAAGSVLIHVVLIAWMLLMQQLVPADLELTEITWFEEEEEPAAPVVAASQPEELPVERVESTPAPAASSARFERETEEAEVEPKPQDPKAMDDRLSDRLAVLRRTAPTRRPMAASVSQPSAFLNGAVAPAEKTGPARASTLVREEGLAKRAPRELHRATGPGTIPRLADAPTSEAIPAPAAAPRELDSTVQRSLAGASLAGPAADRPVLSHPMPSYPDWAKKEGVEASVTLSFVVLPDGRVKKSIVVQRTAGYEDFDRNAESALLRWRFEALPGGERREQWGSITFHYRLSDARS